MRCERGFALILVLIVLSFLAMLGGAALTSTTLDIAIGDSYRTEIQLGYLAEAGIEDAREKLRLSAPRTASQLLSETGDSPFVTGSEFGNYVVFLRNDVADGIASPLDSNHVLTLVSTATIGSATRTIETTVMKSGFPALPAALTLAGDSAGDAGSAASDPRATGEPLDPRLTTPAGVERVLSRIVASATDTTSSARLGNVGNPEDYRIVVVNGDCQFGPGAGYGTLVVRGRLLMSGNFRWNGLILVVGQGEVTTASDSYGRVSGGVFIAHTRRDGMVLPAFEPAIAGFSPGTIAIEANAADTDIGRYAFPYRPIAVREF